MTAMTRIRDLFKLGLGPSSSHTTGPMIAARAFVADAAATVGKQRLSGIRLRAELYGSLARTGRGHGTDRAVIGGFAGLRPECAWPADLNELVDSARSTGRLPTAGLGLIDFDPESSIIFDKTTAPGRHPNAMRFFLFDGAGEVLLSQRWWSVGGGFVEAEHSGPSRDPKQVPPHPFSTAAELLALTEALDCSVADIVWLNEVALGPESEVLEHLAAVENAMLECIERGMCAEGELPGGLHVQRRARKLAGQLAGETGQRRGAPHELMQYVSLFAIAVNEENAAGGRVVTAPTNGAAGVVPAVLRYMREFCAPLPPNATRTYLLTAAAIGHLCKTGASISGAEIGCQGEVGSASAMAAAGLTAVLGGSPEQVEHASEIAIEHHLGLTCDPVGGLVQIPCIERNAFGALKAIQASVLALAGDGDHRVTLDQVIATMRQTGFDMQSKYKETSEGGLAVALAEC